MKSILLASVATVAFAGAAAAEITWSGTGSVSVGRTGSVAAVAGAMTDAQVEAYIDTLANDAAVLAATGIKDWSTLSAKAQTAAARAYYLDLTAAEVKELIADAGLDTVEWTAGDQAAYLADRAALDDLLAIVAGWEDSAEELTAAEITLINSLAGAGTAVAGDTYGDIYTLISDLSDDLDEWRRVEILNEGAAAEAAGDTEMTATGTLTAAMTVGDGYVASLSFNAGTGAFGALSLATPDMGTLTFSPNAIAATVDASDKGGDLKYTNTVGGWAVAVTLDVDADTVEKGSAADARNGVAAVASDSQWSISASGTLSEGTTASVAFDQEGGYAMGVSTTAAGVDLSLGTSMTAAAGAVNTLGVGYSMGDISLGVDYSSEDPANAYTLSVGYAMDATSVSLAYQQNADYDLSIATSVAGFAVTLATDEAAAWSMSASTPIGTAGTLTASTNSKSAMSLTAAFKF